MVHVDRRYMRFEFGRGRKGKGDERKSKMRGKRNGIRMRWFAEYRKVHGERFERQGHDGTSNVWGKFWGIMEDKNFSLDLVRRVVNEGK
jgi:hypothetical protein